MDAVRMLHEARETYPNHPEIVRELSIVDGKVEKSSWWTTFRYTPKGLRVVARSLYPLQLVLWHKKMSSENSSEIRAVDTAGYDESKIEIKVGNA